MRIDQVRLSLIHAPDKEPDVRESSEHLSLKRPRTSASAKAFVRIFKHPNRGGVME